MCHHGQQGQHRIVVDVRWMKKKYIALRLDMKGKGLRSNCNSSSSSSSVMFSHALEHEQAAYARDLFKTTRAARGASVASAQPAIERMRSSVRGCCYEVVIQYHIVIGCRVCICLAGGATRRVWFALPSEHPISKRGHTM